MGHSINKGYFSGKFILRVWGRDGKTLHNSAHDTPEQARSELIKYELNKKETADKIKALANSTIDADVAINALPIVTVREGFERRTGQATPNDGLAHTRPHSNPEAK